MPDPDPHPPGTPAEVLSLGGDRAHEVVDVLCESFRAYPVMRFVVGAEAVDYDARIRTLIGFFTMARVLRGETLLGIEHGSRLAAAALVSRPSRRSPSEVAELRERTWSVLGPAARGRYEAFGAACAPVQIEEEHIHLNMVGVRVDLQGQGLGGRLIEHVHSMSRRDPESIGVTLTTEDPNNVPLYEHLGYEIVGRAVVSPELTTWGFFRPDRRATRGIRSPSSSGGCRGR